MKPVPPDRGPAAVPFDADESPSGRILRVARDQLYTFGYNALTMDALAHELGMSKKTIYVHFDSKDEIVAAVIDLIGQTIRRQAEIVFARDGLSFARRLHEIMEIVGTQFGATRPSLGRELERFAPKLYEKLDGLRRKNIPLVVGRMLRVGVAEGMVRKDVDLDFAVEFWLQAVNGLVHPATLARIGLTAREAFDQGFRLFVGALLTDTGRADLGKQFRNLA